MAKYAITKTGAESFRKLSQTLKASNTELSQCGQQLKTNAAGLNELGDQEIRNSIDELIDQTINAQKKTEEAVDTLTSKLETLAGRIETISSKL